MIQESMQPEANKSGSAPSSRMPEEHLHDRGEQKRESGGSSIDHSRPMITIPGSIDIHTTTTTPSSSSPPSPPSSPSHHFPSPRITFVLLIPQRIRKDNRPRIRGHYGIRSEFPTNDTTIQSPVIQYRPFTHPPVHSNPSAYDGPIERDGRTEVNK